AGVVISKAPLTEYSPLQRLSDDSVATQYSMTDLEKIGLLKMDFLGLRNLTMIAQAVRIIKRTQKVELDLDNMPYDDSNTYQLLSTGETVGVFQLESRGMRGLIKDLRPTAFEEIIALLALYRPGPLESGMVESYVKCKHRQIPIKYMIPELQPILNETYGTILYQEQVMEIASKVAGFSMGQADLLRRAMGKKKHKEMEQQKEFFVNGAVKRGVSKHKAAELFNLVAKFAGYGFNKSHSTAYGVISYQTAYLKANYPVEFLAALLTSVMGNTDKVTAYINECRRLNIQLLPPDVNESFRGFTVIDKVIRFGLSAVKNVGSAAIDNIMECKKIGGHFKSLEDFCERVDSRGTNKKVIESLIKCGAFDSFGQGRAYMLAVLGKFLSRIAVEQKEQANGQSMLFDMKSEVRSQKPEVDTPVQVEEFPPEEKLKLEKELLGLYISGHPLDYLKDSLEGQTNTRIMDIPEMKEGQDVTIGGILNECRKITTKKGEQMAITNIEDLTGSISLLVFPRSYEKCSLIVDNDQVVIVKGRINRDMRSDEFNIVVDTVVPMQELEKVRSLHIELVGINDHNILNQMKELLFSAKGQDPVFLRMDGRSIAIGKEYFVDINPDLIDKLEKLLGSGSVHVEFSAIKKEPVRARRKEKQEVVANGFE
ncbi:MAG: DNA polymerase III subunit alpha, partial [bacterium]